VTVCWADQLYNARMRYHLRTLLIVLAIGPPILAPLMVWGWREYVAWRNRQAEGLSPGSGYLGGEFDDHSPAGTGVAVLSIRPGHAAQAGGLVAGDVIAAINNRPCRDLNDFLIVVDEETVGSRLTMVVTRSGKPTTLRFTLGKRPAPPMSAGQVLQMPVQPRPSRVVDQRQPTDEPIR
jgi:hypothetical protein